MGTEENTAVHTPQAAALETVDALLERLVNFHIYGVPAKLLEAARYDDIDDVRSIASTGVSLDSKDSEGRTALHMASANGHLEIVNYLIHSGVDVNASNAEKNTPLHWACLNGHTEVVKRLVLAGASVSSLNSHERSPMDEAINQGKMGVVDAINEAVAEVELSAAQIL